MNYRPPAPPTSAPTASGSVGDDAIISIPLVQNIRRLSHRGQMPLLRYNRLLDLPYDPYALSVGAIREALDHLLVACCHPGLRGASKRASRVALHGSRRANIAA